MIIPDYILKIIKKVEASGFEIYAVGGCVRDSIMGKAPSDWDLTTSALPQDILKIFKNEKTLAMGLKHGTVTVIFEGNPVEITTYRIDGEYSDNRHPENVIFSTSITEDLKRRDFTINAMAFNPHSGFFDPLGGADDIQSKTIRAVGIPEKRFNEDALRIMRAIRFSATLGFDIEADTKKAIFQCKNLLANIARERITEEFTKLLNAKRPSKVLSKYFLLTDNIFFGDCNELRSPDSFFREMDTLPQETVLRLAAYIILSASSNEVIHTITERFFSNMKFSNNIAHSVKTITKLFTLPIPENISDMRKILVSNSLESVRNWLHIRQIFNPDCISVNNALKMLDKILSNGDCLSVSQLKITGSDLLKAGYRGKAIGIALSLLLTAVVEEKCSNIKEELLNYLNSNTTNI